MTGYTFDANIIIDALAGRQLAHAEIDQALDRDRRAWISRIAWIEVLSKGLPGELRDAERLLSAFDIDEVDADVATRAAELRRERPRLKLPDATILASALVRGRVLVTRNAKDFPETMPSIRIPYIL